MSLHEVTILDTIDVVDSVTRTPNRIDILIQDVIAITDAVLFPRQPAISSFDPAHIRAGDSVVIKGQGFATSIGSNRVTFNGFVATITAAAEDELTVTAPALLAFTENGYALVEVETPPLSAIKASAEVWVKFSTIEEEADELLALQEANLKEVVGVDRPTFAEAGDWNPLQTLMEHSQQGRAEGRAGGFKSRDAVGIVGAPRRNPPDNLNTGGESLVVDPSEPGLLAFGWQLDDTLAFGGRFEIADSGAHLMAANGRANTPIDAETEQIAMLDGLLDLGWFIVKGGGVDTITLFEVLVEGVVEASQAGPAAVSNAVRFFRTNVQVSKGDRIEMRLTKVGVTSLRLIVGGFRVRYR
ncbi:hypothetical protein LCGC14_0273520 [marine sediment metagenome]|uniref:IPT/TIG domain-containing protein n=2 Tax=root TaxID=1 RepID=A0A9C9NK40_9HYPH|nr:hypothetical protein [Aurantimonas coralicida]